MVAETLAISVDTRVVGSEVVERTYHCARFPERISIDPHILGREDGTVMSVVLFLSVEVEEGLAIYRYTSGDPQEVPGYGHLELERVNRVEYSKDEA